jgi:hypothetical protein
MTVRRSVLVVLLAATLADPLAAQLNSMPVHYSPKGGTGFTVYGDFGKGLNEESGENTAFAARAVLGVSAITLGVGVGTVNASIPGLSSDENNFQWMAMAAFRILGGGPIPAAINIQAGYGRLATDSIAEVNVPVGVGLSVSAPVPGITLEVWGAPRISYRRVTVGASSETQTGFGLSGGINFGFSIGLGGYVALDWQSLSDVTDGDFPLIGGNPALLGVGVSWNIKLPGGL